MPSENNLQYPALSQVFSLFPSLNNPKSVNDRLGDTRRHSPTESTCMTLFLQSLCVAQRSSIDGTVSVCIVVSLREQSMFLCHYQLTPEEKNLQR